MLLFPAPEDEPPTLSFMPARLTLNSGLAANPARPHPTARIAVSISQ